MAQKRYGDAVTLFRRRYDSAPHAENLYTLAEALESAGRTEEAGRAFADFEKAALAESPLADNANHELIAYYVDHARRPQQALEIARREIARRPRCPHTGLLRLGARGGRRLPVRGRGNPQGACDRREGSSYTRPRGRHRCPDRGAGRGRYSP